MLKKLQYLHTSEYTTHIKLLIAFSFTNYRSFIFELCYFLVRPAFMHRDYIPPTDGFCV